MVGATGGLRSGVRHRSIGTRGPLGPRIGDLDRCGGLSGPARGSGNRRWKRDPLAIGLNNRRLRWERCLGRVRDFQARRPTAGKGAIATRSAATRARLSVTESCDCTRVRSVSNTGV